MIILKKSILLFLLLTISCGQQQVIQNSDLEQHINNKAIFVANDGNDQNSGKINDPLKTLSAALKIAKPNSTIFLREGNYAATTNISSNKKIYTLKHIIMKHL